MLNYDFINTQDSLNKIIEEAKKCKQISVDTETSSLNVLDPSFKLWLVQLEVNGKAYVIDARKVNLEPLRNILEDDNIIKVLQAAKYDYKVLKVSCGISIKNIYDTMLAEDILYAGLNRRNSLKELAKNYLGIVLDKETRDTFVNFKIEDEFAEEQKQYAAQDVLVLPKIKKTQQLYLKQYGLEPTVNLEFSIIGIVAEMELKGFKLDGERWHKSLVETKKKIFKVGTELRNILPNPPTPPSKPVRLKKDGIPFKNTSEPKPPPVLNLDSWQQMAAALDSVGIDLKKANKITRKGLTNNITVKFAMNNLYKDDSFKKKILSNLLIYRTLKQTDKTFGENLIAHIGKDGRIHANFNQTGTDASRFSADAPNLQNIQKKGEEGKRLRCCFIPGKDNKFVIGDWGQLHLRIIADLSNDTIMLKLFSDPKTDLHKATASKIFNIPYGSVTKEQRDAAKVPNFGVIYGIGENSLADRLGKSKEEAKAIIESYNNTFSVLMNYLEKEGKDAVSRGWSKTTLGRIRWIPKVDSKDKDYKRKVAFYERVGKNNPILSTDGDMLKIAMLMLHNRISEFGATIVNCIHDELVIEAPEQNAFAVAKIVKEVMIKAGQRFVKKVPIVVDVKIRDVWWMDTGADDDESKQQLTLFNAW